MSKRTWDWKEEPHVRKNAEGGRGENKQAAHFISVCPASEFKYLDEVMNRRVESKACSTLESRKAFNRCESSQDMCCALNGSTAYAAPRSPIINGSRVAHHVHLPIHSLQAPLPQCITQGRLASTSSSNMRPKFQEDNRSLGKECSSINISVSCALHNGSDHAVKRHQRLPTNSECRIALSAMTLVTPLSTRQQFKSAIVKTMRKKKKKQFSRTVHANAHRATCDTRPRERDRNRSHYLSLPSPNLRKYVPIVAPPDALTKYMRRMPLHRCMSGFRMEMFCAARMSLVSW